MAGYPSKGELDQLDTVIADVEKSKGKINSFLRSDLGVQLPVHISLSAPLVLRTDQKKEFAEAVTTFVSKSGARIFTIQPTELAWVSNFDVTRYFLVLKLTRPINDDLNKLLEACNASVARYGLERLYDRRTDAAAGNVEDKYDAFHISIAWVLDKSTAENGAMLKAVKLN